MLQQEGKTIHESKHTFVLFPVITLSTTLQATFKLPLTTIIIDKYVDIITYHTFTILQYIARVFIRSRVPGTGTRLL